MAGQFNPADHNVDDVLAHLEQADPAEAQRVQAAEEAGKARKTVLDWAPAQEPTTEDLLGDADPYEVVRAKDAAGNEYNATRVAAISHGSRILTKPAFDGFGQPIPTKTVLDLRAEAPDPTTTPEEN